MSNKKRIGRYIINMNDELGKGAFSVVYGGVIEESGEQVAVKCVSKSMVEQDQYSQNAFFSEIKIMKRLKSPNIIKLIDVHQTKNNFYIVLQRAQSTLRKQLKTYAPFNEKLTMHCLIQILNGFGELVMNGVIHRDLKPDNILIRNNSLKIGDFGFAKNLTSTSSLLKTIVGTPAYMAPQILKEERYTYKCDIWSLGIILYEMVVGKIPWRFTQNNMQGFKNEILNREVVIPESINVSSNIRHFIYGCICIDEEKRFDWAQIFTHPLFGDSFKNNFQKQGSTKITFIMSNLRMNIHSKNLNLNKILMGRSDPLSPASFNEVIRLIEPNYTEEQLSIFFSYVQKDGSVSIASLKAFMEKYDCSLSGTHLRGSSSKIQVEQTGQQQVILNKNLQIIENLKNAIEKNNITIQKVFNGLKEQTVNQETFNSILRRVDPTINDKDCEFVFSGFLIKDSNLADLNALYRFLCKIAQEVPNAK